MITLADSLLGLSFVLISFASFWRLASSYSGKQTFDSRKYGANKELEVQRTSTGGTAVIFLFNFLIFFSALTRSIWFFLPNDFKYWNLEPTPYLAYKTKGSFCLMLSEIILVIGSLSLYGVVVLIACYWVAMLRKLDLSPVDTMDRNHETCCSYIWNPFEKSGTLDLFFVTMVLFSAFESIGIVAYSLQLINSTELLLYDSFTILMVSIALMIVITSLSQQVRIVLHNLETINGTNTQPQIRRIFAIIVATNIFFALRIMIEISMSIYLLYIMETKVIPRSVSSGFWGKHLYLKHFSEVIVLALELIISTAIKSYDSNRASIRQRKLQQQQQYQNVNPVNGLKATDRLLSDITKPAAAIETATTAGGGLSNPSVQSNTTTAAIPHDTAMISTADISPQHHLSTRSPKPLSIQSSDPLGRFAPDYVQPEDSGKYALRSAQPFSLSSLSSSPSSSLRFKYPSLAVTSTQSGSHSNWMENGLLYSANSSAHSSSNNLSTSTAKSNNNLFSSSMKFLTAAVSSKNLSTEESDPLITGIKKKKIYDDSDSNYNKKDIPYVDI